MPRRAPSTRAQVITALQEYTQKELAAILGVSDRSIRRWKNENIEPANPFVRLALQDEYRAESKRIRRLTRKAAPHYPPPEPTGIPLVGERRTLRAFEGGEWTGAYYKSDIVNYNVTGVSVHDVVEILKELRDNGRTVQFIYRVKVYPEGNRKWAPGYHAGTGYNDLRGYKDSELWEMLTKYRVGSDHHRLIYLGIIDK